MKRKLIFSLGILLFFSFVSVNCNAQSSANDQRIVGTWVNGESSVVFNADGSGSITGGAFNYGDRNFTYGISLTGLLGCTWDFLNNQQIYFSPDGRTLIIRGFRFQKR